MKPIHALAAALITVGSLSMAGCAVTRDQSTVGQYVDDSTITTKIKAAYAKDPEVAATSIHVETLNGVVQLSGFAKSQQEKSTAESLASRVEGVKAVKNNIVVRPPSN